jgi:hypothetical protein
VAHHTVVEFAATAQKAEEAEKPEPDGTAPTAAAHAAR